MAEAVTSFVVEKLGNLLIEEATFLHGINDQVQLMQMELRHMRAFLRVAESSPVEDERITNMIMDVREAAYDAEDAVDTFILMKHQRQRSMGVIDFIRRYGCIVQECARRHNIGMQIKVIKTTLQNIFDMKRRYEIHDVTGGTQERVSEVERIVQEKRALEIQREPNVMVGFDDEMDRLVEILLDQEKSRRCVISIVGMEGAGKSTLARKICSRADVMSRFDGCALVSVSQTWNLHKIFEDIASKFSELNREELQKKGEQELKDMVFTCLHDKRYLIVLDDIWNPAVWSLIDRHLPDAKNGGRVIITTRSMDVATFTNPSMEPHKLRLLREDESWDLFNNIVLSARGEDVEKVWEGELKDLAEKILKKCDGLPLAIVLMGGLLSTRERSPIAWNDAVKSMIHWEEVQQGGQVFSKVLGLSYRDLPHHLKSCFLYLSHFPEDFDIEADKLIRLWVAEGFVSDQVDSTMEDIAEGWLEDLVSRCLVQAVKRDHSGMLVVCRMHDVLRDLSITEAEKANFFHIWRQRAVAVCPPLATTWRLVCNGEKGCSYSFGDEFLLPKLHTSLCIGFNGWDDGAREVTPLQSKLIMNSKLLRVLDLEGCTFRELPKAIGDLIHLRFSALTTCHACALTINCAPR